MEDWIEKVESKFTENGFARLASYQLIAEWVDDKWTKVATGDLIMKEFRQYDSIEHAGNISLLHSELEETIKRHQVPKDDIQEVNKVLKKIIALQLEKDSADEEVTYESNKANANENEEGETDSHDYDVDVINLLNAKNV